MTGFIAAGKFTAPLTPGLWAITAQHNVGGGDLWDPQSPTAVSDIDEQQSTTDGVYRGVMIALDIPDLATVYLYADRG